MGRQLWDEDGVILMIQEFHHRYGRVPSASDWNPSLARRFGDDARAERFYKDGCWPSSGTVHRVFGSWNKGIVAAGFTPRTTGRTAA